MNEAAASGLATTVSLARLLGAAATNDTHHTTTLSIQM
jgi:hypothetical protein